MAGQQHGGISGPSEILSTMHLHVAEIASPPPPLVIAPGLNRLEVRELSPAYSSVRAYGRRSERKRRWCAYASARDLASRDR
jgi:hypothetical protein